MWRFLTVSVVMVSMAMAKHEIWEEYKERYGLSFEDDSEERVRLGIFEKNHELIENHNAEAALGKHTYTLAINQFAHMTNKEFADSHNLCRPHLFRNTTKWAADHVYTYDHNLTTPLFGVDWRDKGYVAPVKNQAQCGSCWAFSTTGSLEGQYFKKSGKLVSLSEQQMVDCSGKYGNMGCNGGLMDNAFKYIEKYGIESEADYPYKGKQGSCKYDASKIVTKVTGFTDVPEGDESALQSAVATQGPVSVAIDASHFSFQFYHQGVYNEPDCSTSRLDHGVLAVGYGTFNLLGHGILQGSDYWLVKNSWGTGWGQKGYIMMSRNKDNQCGIATSASYPLL